MILSLGKNEWVEGQLVQRLFSQSYVYKSDVKASSCFKLNIFLSGLLLSLGQATQR